MEQNLRISLAAFLCSIALGSAQAQTLTDSLIAHFPMDGSPNDIVDGLAPTVTQGSPGFCADRFGALDGASCFDGSSFWSYGDVLDMDTSDFSISCWLFVDSVQLPFEVETNFWTYGGLPIDKGLTNQGSPQRAGYGLFAREAQPGSYTVHWGTGGNANDVTDVTHGGLMDVWQHMVLSRCGTHQMLYINGQLVADSVTAESRNLNTNIFFTFGAMNRDPTSYVDTEHFIGALDDVRIYKNRCLSQGEIDTLAFDLLTVGVAEPEQPALALSPNPVGHLLTIAHDGTDAVGARCLIMDGVGRTIKEQLLTADRTVVDVMDIPAGAYFVKLQATQWQAHGKFIKE